MVTLFPESLRSTDSSQNLLNQCTEVTDSIVLISNQTANHPTATHPTAIRQKGKDSSHQLKKNVLSIPTHKTPILSFYGLSLLNSCAFTFFLANIF